MESEFVGTTLKLGLKRHDMEAMFVNADENGDGQIDIMEFLQARDRSRVVHLLIRWSRFVVISSFNGVDLS